MTGTHFTQIIRWPNLLIVVLVQAILYRGFVHSSHSMLGPGDFSMLTVITMLIAASGYTINDYYDRRIDRINKPHRWIAGNVWSLKSVLTLYFILVALGLILTVLLAFRMSLLAFSVIYPIAIMGLWLYSFRLKCMPVAGNLWVSLFCAGVVVVIALPDLILGSSATIRPELWFYALFAFLSTWYREVVKDLEDIAGDREAGCGTFVVWYGTRAGKIMAIGLGLFLLGALFFWNRNQTNTSITLIILLLQGFVIVSLALIWRALDNLYFHYASIIIKAVMLTGTLALLIM